MSDDRSEARLVEHPEPGKVWVQIPHRNDIGSDWIAVDELPGDDEIAGRLSALLCDLTGGRMSKTHYSVATMIQAVEAEFEKYASDEMVELTAQRDRAEQRHERLESAVEALAEEFESEIDWSNGRNNYGDNAAWESAARQVRALIAPESRPA